MTAAKAGSIDCVRLLLKSGASLINHQSLVRYS